MSANAVLKLVAWTEKKGGGSAGIFSRAVPWKKLSAGDGRDGNPMRGCGRLFGIFLSFLFCPAAERGCGVVGIVADKMAQLEAHFQGKAG